MATYAEAKAIRDTIYDENARLSASLREFPKDAMGMTPDNIKQSAEYQFAKGLYDASFVKLRTFNAYMTRNFARQMREDRRTRSFSTPWIG